jgi:hypothetical protein
MSPVDGRPAGEGSLILVVLNRHGEPQIVLGDGGRPAAPRMPSADGEPEAGSG